MDQAKELRNIMNSTQSTGINKLSSRVITVSSGKGGVGKTNFSVNIAIQMAKMGNRVLVIDADFGLANISVLLGVVPEYNFYHLLKGQKTISEIIIDTDMGIQFISGGSGLKELSNINNTEIKYFIEQFEYIDKMVDIILIDTGAGISSSVTNFIMASDEVIIVTTAEPTSFTDAYTLIKVIKEQNKEIDKINLVVNRADDEYEADRVFKKLAFVCNKFAGVTLENMGYILADADLIKAVKRQKPVILLFPNSKFSEAIRQISNKILNKELSVQRHSGIKSFMKKLLKTFNN